MVQMNHHARYILGVPKNGPPGKYGPILTIFSPLQQEIYDAQELSYFSHLTFIMMLHYLAKQTLILVLMLLPDFPSIVP